MAERSPRPWSVEDRAKLFSGPLDGEFESGFSRYEATVRAAEAERDTARYTTTAVKAERDRLAARVAVLQHLIDYAMHLHEHGEGAPGHELSSWGGWYRSVRALADDGGPDAH